MILACAVCATFARQGAAVATLSVFVSPMITEFGWSRTELSGAVSLGGVLGALTAPLFGARVDRNGARVVLVLSALVLSGIAFVLAGVQTLFAFYVAFSIGRMICSTPFDIGVSAAITNWFVRKRALAMSLVSLATGVSIAVMPLMSQAVIDCGGWRAGWIAVAAAVLLVGAIPNALFMRRRPEDVGLTPDGDRASAATTKHTPRSEVKFTAREALRTRAAWLLMFYTALVFPVQAGMSLHQAPHMIERGITPLVAASIVSVFSLTVALSGLGYGIIGARLPVRRGLAISAAVVALGAYVMHGVTDTLDGYLAAALFGAGIGGLLTLLPVAWADYYGRNHFGAIRGITLPVQVLGQAAGPLIAGVLYDATGDYGAAWLTFCVMSAAAVLIVLAAKPPPSPTVKVN